MVTCSPTAMGLRARTEKVKESMSHDEYALGAQLGHRDMEALAWDKPYMITEKKISVTCGSCEKRWPPLHPTLEGISPGEAQ